MSNHSGTCKTPEYEYFLSIVGIPMPTCPRETKKKSANKTAIQAKIENYNAFEHSITTQINNGQVIAELNIGQSLIQAESPEYIRPSQIIDNSETPVPPQLLDHARFTEPPAISQKAIDQVLSVEQTAPSSLLDQATFVEPTAPSSLIDQVSSVEPIAPPHEQTAESTPIAQAALPTPPKEQTAESTPIAEQAELTTPPQEQTAESTPIAEQAELTTPKTQTPTPLTVEALEPLKEKEVLEHPEEKEELELEHPSEKIAKPVKSSQKGSFTAKLANKFSKDLVFVVENLGSIDRTINESFKFAGYDYTLNLSGYTYARSFMHSALSIVDAFTTEKYQYLPILSTAAFNVNLHSRILNDHHPLIQCTLETVYGSLKNIIENSFPTIFAVNTAVIAASCLNRELNEHSSKEYIASFLNTIRSLMYFEKISIIKSTIAVLRAGWSIKDTYDLYANSLYSEADSIIKIESDTHAEAITYMPGNINSTET